MLTLLEVERQAFLLSVDDRAKLAELLLESIQSPALSDIETAWENEITARVKAFDQGAVTTYSAEEVFAQAKRLCQ